MTAATATMMMIVIVPENIHVYLILHKLVFKIYRICHKLTVEITNGKCYLASLITFVRTSLIKFYLYSQRMSDSLYHIPESAH